MSPTIRHKYKYFHSIVQRAKDRRQKFQFCCLPFDVRPRNVKLNLSINSGLRTAKNFEWVDGSPGPSAFKLTLGCLATWPWPCEDCGWSK